MNELYDYMQAGYTGSTSQKPPYPSSPVYMAYMAGVWCRLNNIPPQEIKSGRGYKMIVNRRWSLNYKCDDNNPVVTQL